MEWILSILGEIHIDVLENYDMKARAYVAQIDFHEIVKLTKLERRYVPLPKYPAVLRDLGPSG